MTKKEGVELSALSYHVSDAKTSDSGQYVCRASAAQCCNKGSAVNVTVNRTFSYSVACQLSDVHLSDWLIFHVADHVADQLRACTYIYIHVDRRAGQGDPIRSFLEKVCERLKRFFSLWLLYMCIQYT
jgi:hypothetical protein